MSARKKFLHFFFIGLSPRPGVPYFRCALCGRSPHGQQRCKLSLESGPLGFVCLGKGRRGICPSLDGMVPGRLIRDLLGLPDIPRPDMSMKERIRVSEDLVVHSALPRCCQLEAPSWRSKIRASQARCGVPAQNGSDTACSRFWANTVHAGNDAYRTRSPDT